MACYTYHPQGNMPSKASEYLLCLKHVKAVWSASKKATSCRREYNCSADARQWSDIDVVIQQGFLVEVSIY